MVFYAQSTSAVKSRREITRKMTNRQTNAEEDHKLLEIKGT